MKNKVHWSKKKFPLDKILNKESYSHAVGLYALENGNAKLIAKSKSQIKK